MFLTSYLSMYVMGHKLTPTAPSYQLICAVSPPSLANQQEWERKLVLNGEESNEGWEAACLESGCFNGQKPWELSIFWADIASPLNVWSVQGDMSALTRYLISWFEYNGSQWIRQIRVCKPASSRHGVILRFGTNQRLSCCLDRQPAVCIRKDNCHRNPFAVGCCWDVVLL